jgi:7,8-dihydropterin-6-yl-methyl-4-(beta-D-ribofuranosyl)aminobenzene 5'-phosphate synthase
MRNLTRVAATLLLLSVIACAGGGTEKATPVNLPGTLKLTILYDNAGTDSRLKPGWGFAALVECGGDTLLFDAGADGSFLDNMRQLSLDPRSIEAVILSHEHYDHTGGLQALLDAGIRPTVYAPSQFSTGFKERVRTRTSLVEVTDAVEILPGVHTTRPVGLLSSKPWLWTARTGRW